MHFQGINWCTSVCIVNNPCIYKNLIKMCPEYERSKMITIEYPAIEKRLWAIWSSEMNFSLKWHINWELD